MTDGGRKKTEDGVVAGFARGSRPVRQAICGSCASFLGSGREPSAGGIITWRFILGLVQRSLRGIVNGGLGMADDLLDDTISGSRRKYPACSTTCYWVLFRTLEGDNESVANIRYTQ
jgi:hypothetical protein